MKTKKTFKNFVQQQEDSFSSRQKNFQQKLRAHHAIYALMGGTGVVMFWYGLWEGLDDIYNSYAATNVLAYIGHPAAALIIGVSILAFSGLFVGELLGKIGTIEEKAEELATTQEVLEEEQDELQEEQKALKEEQDELQEEHDDLAEEVATVSTGEHQHTEDLELARYED